MEQPTPPASAADASDGNEATAVASGSQRRSSQEFSPNLRRSSSGNLSNYSNYSGAQGTIGPGNLRRTTTRQFSRSSADFAPHMPTIDENSQSEKHDEHSHWHAFSLVFVALPAVAGLVFENGSAVMTDVLLLGLGCLFLYWSVKWPFQWYHSAQAKLFLIMDDLDQEDDFAVADESVQGEETNEAEKSGILDDTPEKKTAGERKQERKQREAIESLRNMELTALTSCFLSPMAVAYLLHAIRPYLSRPSGGLVSNSNLTLFVLAAEVRPIMHVLKLVEARTLHLQRIVTEPPVSSAASAVASDQIDELMRRINALETPGAAKEISSNVIPEEDAKESSVPSSSEQVDAAAVTAAIKASIQPQLDALNRAVRRYEKRATTQSVVLEARLHALDSRVNDALSLAAAASRMAQQKPSGLFTWITQSINYLVASIMSAILSLILSPWKLMATVYAYFRGSFVSTSTGKGTGRKKFEAGTSSSAGAKLRPEKSPVTASGGTYVITRGKLTAKV